MVAQLELQIRTDPMAVREARARLRAWLHDTPCGDGCAGDAELVASELLTNALMHARTVAALKAAVRDDRLHIEVHDRRSTPPTVPGRRGASGGFGLGIIDAVSVAWGWKPTQSGKVVWADLALSPTR